MSKRAEEWRPLLNFEGRYEVSNLGRIKSLKRNKIIKTHISPQGYMCASLRYIGEKKTRTIRIHRAIAQAFIPNPNNYPIINHKDGNKLNNSIDNLEWCTCQHNIRHSFDNRLQKPSGRLLVGDDYVKIRAMYLNGYRYSEMVEALSGKVAKATIYWALKRNSYLEWYSEEEFQSEVKKMMSVLPQKEIYRKHQRIHF